MLFFINTDQNPPTVAKSNLRNFRSTLPSSQPWPLPRVSTTSSPWIVRRTLLCCPATTPPELKKPPPSLSPSCTLACLSPKKPNTLAEKGTETPLSDYKGKVVLVVNTASKCGMTPQYKGLEALYQKLKAKHGDDFMILGFPCNQFAGQEPGTDDDIQNFCQVNYGVTFPVMKKIDVNGANAAPLYQWLKEAYPGIMGLRMIKWNFEKFLIGRDGKVKGRWASTTKPETLEQDITKELDKEA